MLEKKREAFPKKKTERRKKNWLEKSRKAVSTKRERRSSWKNREAFPKERTSGY